MSIRAYTLCHYEIRPRHPRIGRAQTRRNRAQAAAPGRAISLSKSILS